jgi:hypothetical protein
VGLAHLWKQNAFRFLGSYTAVPETQKLPALNFSVGVQGIGTGNPGFSGTLEKNFLVSFGTVNVYAGLGLRSNEDHGHPVGGVKLTLPSGIALGLQDDGHKRNPFATYSKDWWTAGVYLVGGKTPAYLVGLRY